MFLGFEFLLDLFLDFRFLLDLFLGFLDLEHENAGRMNRMSTKRGSNE